MPSSIDGGNTASAVLVFAPNPQNDHPAMLKQRPVWSSPEPSACKRVSEDPDADDENVVLDVTASGSLTPTIDDINLKIDDDETQTYVFKVTTDKPKEGSPINVTLRADPAHVNDSLALTLHSDNAKYTP